MLTIHEDRSKHRFLSILSFKLTTRSGVLFLFQFLHNGMTNISAPKVVSGIIGVNAINRKHALLRWLLLRGDPTTSVFVVVVVVAVVIVVVVGIHTRIVVAHIGMNVPRLPSRNISRMEQHVILSGMLPVRTLLPIELLQLLQRGRIDKEYVSLIMSSSCRPSFLGQSSFVRIHDIDNGDGEPSQRRHLKHR
jgi:hypothetical protein